MSSYDYKTILERANQCKTSVEKDYKLGINERWSYYFAKSIIEPKKSFTQISFREAPKSTGDNLNRQIVKKNFTSMANRLIHFVETNKSLPNYITVDGKKVNVEDYTYMFARIVIFYNKNNQLPNYAIVNSSAFSKPKQPVSKKYGHSKKSGCDNMGQNNGYYCACHSLQEVIRNLYNIVVPQSTIAQWAGTTSAGTSHNGIRTAVSQFNKKYNKNLQMSEKNFSDLGWTGIKKIVNSSNQDCIIHNLYRNQYGHYEVVNDVSSNINVQNSLGSKCSGSCYCGYIEYRTQSTFRSYINGISQKSILVFTRG